MACIKCLTSILESGTLEVSAVPHLPGLVLLIGLSNVKLVDLCESSMNCINQTNFPGCIPQDGLDDHDRNVAVLELSFLEGSRA